MLTRSGAHVHTQFCDGRSTAEEMAIAAIRNGFVSLGFSSHGPQPFDERYAIAKAAPYRQEVLRLREKYRDVLPIYLGVERDFYSTAKPKEYDYFIGSVHYLPDGDARFPVDGSAEMARAYVDECRGGDGLRFAKDYYALLSEYVRAMPPAIIGHFDLVRKNNAALRLFDEDGPAYRRAALNALESMRDSGALLEVNTGGMARGYLSSPYPALFLLRQWRAWGGRVILNADCHNAAYIAHAYDEAEDYIRAAGYTSAVRLGTGQSLWEEYGL